MFVRLIIFLIFGALPVEASTYQQPLSEQAAMKVLAPRRLFLFVGVDQFADPGFPALEFPSKDVENFLQFVRANNWSDQDSEIVLVGKEANLTNVMLALDAIERQNLSEEDLVLIYFSTHGTLNFSPTRQLERYAVLYDTKFKHTRDKGLAIEYLENRLGRFRSQKKALILALCHSGSGKSVLPLSIDAELKSLKGTYFSKPLHEASAAMMVLSASSWGEPAREDKNLKNDVYTHFLLEGLIHNDTNEDGAVSLFEAHEYARSKTYDFTRGAQTPAALVNLKGMDPLILKGKVQARGFPLVFADSEVWRNLTLKINGRVKGTLWEPKQAEFGNVRVALVDPEHPEQPLLDHYVYLKPHNSYPVSTLLAHRTSIRIQSIISQIPVDFGFDGVAARSARSVGIGVSIQEILSTPLVANFEYLRMNRRLKKTIDYDRTDVVLTSEHLKLGLGYIKFLTPSLALEANFALETLNIQRQISNPSYTQRAQDMSLTFPSFGIDVRYLNIAGPLFAGLGTVFYPWRDSIIRIADSRQPLLPVTGRLVLGMTL
ncbi:caspase family protein [Oligoflexus sp.]|uniref:caspase family protein n=1 Tax=Oligoflexus sp. TaxID=1971216 RepID=UPI002D77EC44|nr:hypothetical protein [Oligoflexus sp.]